MQSYRIAKKNLTSHPRRGRTVHTGNPQAYLIDTSSVFIILIYARYPAVSLIVHK